MSRKFGFLVLLAAFAFSVTRADAAGNMIAPSSQAAAPSYASTVQPDLISFGVGYMDFDKSEIHKKSADFRAEYRWGLSLLDLITPYFRTWDPYIQFHPYAGVETTSRGALYGSGGWSMDGYIYRHYIVTWTEGVGFYEPGDMKSLNSFIQFRSMLEAGYRFDNEMRLTAEISHISDAGISKHNPGAEIVGAYLHVPVGALFGR
jgi:hypothetical protein